MQEQALVADGPWQGNLLDTGLSLYKTPCGTTYERREIRFGTAEMAQRASEKQARCEPIPVIYYSHKVINNFEHLVRATRERVPSVEARFAAAES